MMEEVKDIQVYNTDRTINYQIEKLNTTMLNEADFEFIRRAFGFKMYDVLENAGGRQVLFFPMQFSRQRKLDGETASHNYLLKSKPALGYPRAGFFLHHY